jgi:histidinol-phosphatase (PHP family)
MLTDYHVHLRPDEDAATAEEHITAANAERYRAAAEEHGIAELGVAEHVHRFTAALEVWRHPWYRRWARDDLEAYVEVVRDETDLRLGLECDFLPGREDRLANLLEPYDWDYVVGSVHFLREESVDAEDFDVWDRAASADQVWKRYFETLGEAARSGLFDILAHPDLVKVWGPERPRPEGDLRRFYERAMDGIAESRIAVEVSTAGLRKPVSEIYPDPAFLGMCLEAGCPVALSSDAHVPAQIGFRYEQALELLDGLGVTELAVFERRERRLEPIA